MAYIVCRHEQHDGGHLLFASAAVARRLYSCGDPLYMSFTDTKRLIDRARVGSWRPRVMEVASYIRDLNGTVVTAGHLPVAIF